MKYATEIPEPSKGSRRILPDGRTAVCLNTHAVQESLYYEIAGGNGAGGWLTWREWAQLREA